jgi:hypothetical protein
LHQNSCGDRFLCRQTKNPPDKSGGHNTFPRPNPSRSCRLQAVDKSQKQATGAAHKDTALFSQNFNTDQPVEQLFLTILLLVKII